MPIVVPTGSGSSGGVPGPGAPESLVLDGLDFTVSPYMITAIEHTPAAKRLEWAEAVDGDGALLVRDPLSENSRFDVTVEIRENSRDLAHTALGLIIDKLEESERHPLGIPLVHTPAESSDSTTWWVLTGEVTKIPIDIESGYFASPPVLQVNMSLTCQPFGDGAEALVATGSGSARLVELEIPVLGGDVDAEARLEIVDTASQSSDLIVWGREYRHRAATDQFLTQPNLTATGFAGTSTTRSGSVSTNVYRGTLTTSPVAVCGTGNQPHVGVYRVVGAFWATGTGVRVRFAYRDGDGPIKSLLWETPPAEDAWVEIDLGVITVSEAPFGTQRWVGQVEAYTDTPGDTLDVDYLILVPAGEGYGRARKPLSYPTAQTFAARDEFDQTGGNLSTKTLPVGGSWAEAGGAGNYEIETTNDTAIRGPVTGEAIGGGRFAIAGATSYTDLVVEADHRHNSRVTTGTTTEAVGVYTDANNWAVAAIVVGANDSTNTLVFYKRVGGGAVATVAQVAIPVIEYTKFRHTRLYVSSGGVWAIWSSATGSYDVDSVPAPSPAPILAGRDSDLATGGGIASRKPALYDENGSATTGVQREYDNFIAFAPAADAVVFSGQSVQFRSNGDAIREDASGAYPGRVPEYRGGPFTLSPGGPDDRTNRVAVLRRRNDTYSMAEPSGTDAFTINVYAMERYLHLPR
jgi:hypothetical protein